MASGFSSSLSGLNSAFFRQSVTADNVANLDTNGFKARRAEQSSVEAGGTAVDAVTRNTSQGALIPTGRSQDVAIEGEGFFPVQVDGETRYTRTGSFNVDADGNVVNTVTGGVVEGYEAGQSGGASEPLQLTEQQQTIEPRATDTIGFEGNLSAGMADGDTRTVSADLVDSRGRNRSLTVNFERLNSDEFQFTATDPETGNSALQGTLTFDSGGQVESVDVSSSPNSPGGFEGLYLTGDGSEPLTVSESNLDFSNVTLQGGSSDLSVGEVSGREAGSLRDVSVGSDGSVRGQYSNGETRTLGQVAISRFENAGGLEAAGGSLFQPTANSGDPLTGAPGTDGRGRLRQGFLEASNVDLTDEMIGSIVNRNTTEANVGALRVQDEMMGSLLDLTG